jgi:DNA-directed RNA polymerase specialized sigma24 family protein
MLAIIDSGSICIECNKRLTNLYNESHHWLLKHSIKLTKNREEGEDLVQDLYEYLHLKCNPNIFWGTAYHMFYCYRFLESRWINKVKKLNRVQNVGLIGQDYGLLDEVDDTIYDEEKDLSIERAHQQILDTLKTLSVTRHWPQAKIFELYWMSDDTLDEVASKIKISKSTTFLAVKKIKRLLKEVIENPFDESSKKI